MQRRGHGWQALPNISDGHETYELVLTVAHTHGRWLVSNVSSPAMSTRTNEWNTPQGGR